MNLLYSKTISHKGKSLKTNLNLLIKVAIVGLTMILLVKRVHLMLHQYRLKMLKTS